MRTDDFLTTKISWMHRQKNFHTLGAPLCAREFRYYDYLGKNNKIALKVEYVLQVNFLPI